MFLPRSFLPRRTAALAALLAVLPWLSGCGAAPATPAEFKAAKCGPRPSNVQATVRRYVQQRSEALGGPVKLASVGKLDKGYMDPPVIGEQFPRRWGWTVTILYQGPDQRGGSLPYTYRDTLFFRDGKFVHAANNNTFAENLNYGLADGLAQQAAAQRAAASGEAPAAEEDGGDEGTPDYLQPGKKKKKR